MHRAGHERHRLLVPGVNVDVNRALMRDTAGDNFEWNEADWQVDMHRTFDCLTKSWAWLHFQRVSHFNKAINRRSFSTKPTFSSLLVCRVRNWALKFGVDLWEFGRQFTKMSDIKNVSTRAHQRQKDDRLRTSVKLFDFCSEKNYRSKRNWAISPAKGASIRSQRARLALTSDKQRLMFSGATGTHRFYVNFIREQIEKKVRKKEEEEVSWHKRDEGQRKTRNNEEALGSEKGEKKRKRERDGI
jgi:hypothetical protein